MAEMTDVRLRNATVYSVFVRNYSEEGTFAAVAKDVNRIEALGTDIVWLMPIHPIGEKARKGTCGSPYAIKDYRAVNPDYGTLDDFKALVDAIHGAGMKCIIDVVYNHTSPDSVLSQEHPAWFYHREDGSFGNKVGDWSDIIDLDYRNQGLWDYQIETLKYWAGIVDGFRCDVASLVPVDFWIKARAEVEKVHPGCLWLAESVEPDFVTYNRSRGVDAWSDGEVFRAFDMEYEYDVFTYYRDYINQTSTLHEYADALNRQEASYPENYVKLRFLENHDNKRSSLMLGTGKVWRNWTAFIYFNKGCTLIYNGQETGTAHRPELFEKDPIDWTSPMMEPISEYLAKLASIKKNILPVRAGYKVTALEETTLAAVYSDVERPGRVVLGVFRVGGRKHIADLWHATTADGESVNDFFPDGTYTNLIDGQPFDICQGSLQAGVEPVIVEGFKQ